MCHGSFGKSTLAQQRLRARQPAAEGLVGLGRIAGAAGGVDRLAQALRSGIPGYRVRVIGEDRGTIQILVSSDNEDRRPG